MHKRALGRGGPQVSTMCLGGNVFGWTADERASFDVLDAFVAAGGNFIDTADVYSRWAPGHRGGESETVIGRWLARRKFRDDVVIATKVGMDMGDGNVGLSRRWIERAVEDSLRRLGTDYIDLYQAHKDDAQTLLEESLGAFDALVRAGKVRHIGASNYEAPRLAAALDVSRDGGLARYVSLQPLYNLMDRAGFEQALQPLCVQQGIGVFPYYGLASGFLTGKYRTAADAGKSARGPGVVKKYLDARGLRVLDALDAAARATGATPAKLSIAWLLSRPAITSALVSATSVSQLEEIVAGADLALDADTIAALDAASAPPPA